MQPQSIAPPGSPPMLARLLARIAGAARARTRPQGDGATPSVGPPSPGSPPPGPPASPYPLDQRPGAEDPFAALRGRRILFDGVFKGDYSLAIVNRQLARALLAAGIDLALHSPEDGLADDPHLADTAEVAARLGPPPDPGEEIDIHLRNTWPPRAEDMRGRLNVYVCFAWEESHVPAAIVGHFNAHLDLLLVTARFVEEAFRRSGLRVPVAVIGNGVDHLPAARSPGAPGETVSRRRILHVSSCFPRKGADVLVQSVARHFGQEDGVELVIKTFENRHNTIEQTVAAARAAHPDAPPITVIKRSLPAHELRRLIAGSAVLAAPSRGEGFGLPLAEALMLGVPVVTTGWSGQTDFCTEETAFLVDYALVPSGAHVTAGGAATWAEPDPGALATALRAALDRPDEAARRTAAGRALLAAHFTWARVAERLGRALGELPARRAFQQVRAPARIELVSSWNQACGIATYAAHLFATDALAPRLGHVHARLLRDDAARIDDREDVPVTRRWGYDRSAMQALARDLASARHPVLWLQHHPGQFSEEDMTLLAAATAGGPHRTRLITLHNVQETLERPAAWLSAFDAVIVHTRADMQALESRTDAAVVVIPHGILPAPDMPPPDPAHVTVGTFGFLYPHKNVPLLVEALARALPYAPQLRLRLLTCARAEAVSLKERARVEATIAALGIADRVETDFGFLDEETVRRRLAGCDLLCFPYGPSSESATGAARVALSLDRPILCSASDVLRDIRPLSIGLQRLDAAGLAEALVVLAASPELRRLRAHERRQSVARHGYERVAARHAGLIDRLSRGHADAA